jgi:hypothetical protein
MTTWHPGFCQARIKGISFVTFIAFLLQSSGVFSEGIAGTIKKRYGGGGGGGGEQDSANFIPKPKLNLQVNKMNFNNLFLRVYYKLFNLLNKI